MDGWDPSHLLFMMASMGAGLGIAWLLEQRSMRKLRDLGLLVEKVGLTAYVVRMPGVGNVELRVGTRWRETVTVSLLTRRSSWRVVATGLRVAGRTTLRAHRDLLRGLERGIRTSVALDDDTFDKAVWLTGSDEREVRALLRDAHARAAVLELTRLNTIVDLSDDGTLTVSFTTNLVTAAQCKRALELTHQLVQTLESAPLALPGRDDAVVRVDAIGSASGVPVPVPVLKR